MYRTITAYGRAHDRSLLAWSSQQTSELSTVLSLIRWIIGYRKSYRNVFTEAIEGDGRARAVSDWDIVRNAAERHWSSDRSVVRPSLMRESKQKTNTF